MKACDSERDSFKAGSQVRPWYRGGCLLVRKYSQFLATVQGNVNRVRRGAQSCLQAVHLEAHYRASTIGRTILTAQSGLNKETALSSTV
jgi:hypothetical protein